MVALSRSHSSALFSLLYAPLFLYLLNVLLFDPLRLRIPPPRALLSFPSVFVDVFVDEIHAVALAVGIVVVGIVVVGIVAVGNDTVELMMGP